MTPAPGSDAQSAASILSSGTKGGRVAGSALSDSKKPRADSIPRGLPRPEESATTVPAHSGPARHCCGLPDPQFSRALAGCTPGAASSLACTAKPPAHRSKPTAFVRLLASRHPGVAVPHAAAGRSVIRMWSVSVVAIRVIIRPRRDCASDDSTGNDSANHSSGTPTPAAPPGFRAA